jgi:hypothetical protein
MRDSYRHQKLNRLAQKSTPSTPTHRSPRPPLTASINSLVFTNEIF